MVKEELWAVVMAGGSGTRFWPASRRARPKQFLPIAGDLSMIGATVQRLEGLIGADRILVVTSGDLAPLVSECLPMLCSENVLVEPVGRNTAPCVALAALEIERRAPDSVHVVLPADHVIAPPASFQASLVAAAEEARRARHLCTLGIRPTFPATGYGYIEAGDELACHGEFSAHHVERFVEKPDHARAEEFLTTGRYLWNAGIFVWETRTVIEAIRDHAPEILEPLEVAGSSTGLEEVYPQLPALPIDTAVMEQATNRSVLPISYAWSDVGAWNSLEDVAPRDDQGNSYAGGTQVVSLDSSDNLIYADAGELVALIGVKDLIVVRSGDALLVCPKDRAQDVKDIVERLKKEGPEFL
jgi:mannose-1-phosphate guanylyltransferase